MLRLKRLRKNLALRDLVAQTNLSPSQLVMPYFISEGKNIRQPIPAMPGICRLSPDELLKDAAEIKKSGLNSIILFGRPKNKYDNGLSAYQENGVIQKAIAALKKNFGDELVVITDVCLCGYVNHGHCGIIKSSRPSSVVRIPYTVVRRSSSVYRYGIRTTEYGRRYTINLLDALLT